jgi:glycosyltransferase involved in cell wall biosynthesis
VRVLIDYRPALRERSGVGEYTHQLAKALLRSMTRPLELTLFSSSWRDRLSLPDDLVGAAIVDRRVPVSLLNLCWHRFGWPPAESLATRAFDVTHSLHPLLLPARNAAQVITIHDLNFLSHPERTRAEIRRDYPVLAGAHARRADAIVTPSAFTAGEITRQFGVDPARIAICSPGAPDWTPRGSMPRDGYLLFFGTLEPRKNVGALLDAYEQLLAGAPRAASSKLANVGHGFGGDAAIPELVLAGKATEQSGSWLDRIARPPLRGVVRHIGYVDPAERQALYAGARLLVMPSYEEGFGLPVLEAMAAGVPVVAARRGALPEVLGGAGPLVDPDEPSDIAAGITRLLSDASYAEACVAAGLKRAAQFRWAQTADRVYDAYQQAMTRRAAEDAAV